MFGQQYDSGNRKFSISMKITTPVGKKIRVWAEEAGRKNSKYVDREVIVEGSKTIFLNFPVSPSKLFIGALNCDSPKDSEFKVEIVETPIRDYSIWIDYPTEQFLSMALQFCQICGYERSSPNGRMFKNETGNYRIKFMDIIKDANGKVYSTPARIGHQTGIIEISKAKYDNYTVAMRMMIILHEYSHVYKNPKTGLEISNEIGADINALYIYLGLGFSKIDAICVFANVFLKAQTQGNINRMRKIMDYIGKFENQDFARRNW